jgi:hypothetical protein
MKLSENTINLLKNFAGINPNMVFKAGSSIATIAEAKNIMASATVTETFPQEFGIYDLNEFLSTLTLVDNPDLSFSDDSITIKDGKTSIRYFYASMDLLTAPSKQVTMPNPEVTFILSEDTLNKIRKASSVLGHANIEIKGENGKIIVNLTDAKNASANKYSIVVDENNACKEVFSFIMVISNLKMVSGDYTVEISSKLISHLKHTTLPVEYWIALEKTSTFA